MKIYRLQTETNQGIYHFRLPNNVNANWYKIKHQLEYDNDCNPERRVHPDNDQGTALQQLYFHGALSEYIFGVKFDDIYHWFTPVELGMYEASDLSLFEYTVADEHVIHGAHQVAFKLSNAIDMRKIKHTCLRHCCKKT